MDRQKWTKVVTWTKSDSACEVELVLRSGERINCTKSHLWPTQRGEVKAGNLHVGDKLIRCKLPESSSDKLAAWLCTDAFWFLGLYLAEGSRSGGTAPTRAIQISLHKDEIDLVPRLQKVASHFGGSLTHSTDGNKLSVRLYGRALDALVNMYIGGVSAKTKHLKAPAWELPNHALRLVMEGYLTGDGHDDTGNNRVRLGFCRNYQLERDLRVLAARLGAVLTLKPTESAYQHGVKPSFRGEWRWDTTSTHWNVKDRGEIVEIKRGKAKQSWDVTVEDSSHLFSLASGVLTHNSKGNPMPESVTDRPTRSYENVFLLSKSPQYFYDADAIREPMITKVQRRLSKTHQRSDLGKYRSDRRPDLSYKYDGVPPGNPVGRNKRDVWAINTRPFKGAHFATMPPELALTCVKAGTSAHGCCTKCGAPYTRVLAQREKQSNTTDAPRGKAKELEGSVHFGQNTRRNVIGSTFNNNPNKRPSPPATIGWKPTCKCKHAAVMPCVVLDPFNGAGTTGLVSLATGRNYVGIDLNPEYLEIATRRLQHPVLPGKKAKPVKVAKPHHMRKLFED